MVAYGGFRVMQSWGHFTSGKYKGKEFTQFDFDDDWYDDELLTNYIQNKLFKKVIKTEIQNDGYHVLVQVIGEGRL